MNSALKKQMLPIFTLMSHSHLHFANGGRGVNDAISLADISNHGNIMQSVHMSTYPLEVFDVIYLKQTVCAGGR